MNRHDNLNPLHQAVFLDEMPADELARFKTVVIVEASWQNAGKVVSHPTLQALPHVKIRDQQTVFWRYQECSGAHLATIEAIHYFHIAYYEARHGAGSYDGRYDDLLLSYSCQHRRIRDNSSNKRPPKGWKLWAEDGVEDGKAGGKGGKRGKRGDGGGGAGGESKT
jgi:DTW domain-containing protein YfiP